MKAIVLAAGKGTRLRPFSAHTPKPLFTIDGRPVLDHAIRALIRAGAEAVIVNTHHLHEQIAAHIAGQAYPIPVRTRHEDTLLGTGGAIKNTADFWDDRPFMIVNGDIYTDIDLGDVYRFHQRHGHDVTLVLTDAPRVNQVLIDRRQRVRDFSAADADPAAGEWKLCFTGIHVVHPRLLKHIPAGRFHHIIDTYRSLLAENRPIQAMVATDRLWRDIGSPRRYRNLARRIICERALCAAFPREPPGPVHMSRLTGDGSQRCWFRLQKGNRRLILVDHGIQAGRKQSEAAAFVAIGTHLQRQAIPVPRMIRHDIFAGLVVLEDLGDCHLQQAVARRQTPEAIFSLYRRLIEQTAAMAIDGAHGFDTAWTWQSAYYDRVTIIEKECRYFCEAFLHGFLGQPVDFTNLLPEFNVLADRALDCGVSGFMHRDLQSRNIMLKGDQPFFIDFQGGRLGPVQYDLASLLIDPYVDLSPKMQEDLYEAALEAFSRRMSIDPAAFRCGFEACALTRNLQILGAFGYLSTVAQKPFFKTFIPAALKTLQRNLFRFTGESEFPDLKNVVDTAAFTIEEKTAHRSC